MMAKRPLPLIASLVVGAAVLAMIALGFWQLQRANWKNGLIAQYAQASRLPPILYPTLPIATKDLPLYRYATGNCLEVVGRRTVAGTNRSGEPGFAMVADCRSGAERPGIAVVIGWSKDPKAGTNWKGGPVSGIIGPDAVTRMHLVADGAAPGLEPASPPSVESIPNNHRSYAVQWFLFAAVALIIYVIALRGLPLKATRSDTVSGDTKPPETSGK